MENTPSLDLYNLLVTRDFDPEILDSAGKSVTDPAEAELFSFDWKTQNKNYGTVVILLGADQDLEVYYGDNLGRGMESEDRQDWYRFLEQIKSFATRNLLNFKLNNLNRLKYTMQGMAAIREGLFEGYYGRKNISYSDQPKQTRLMIRHTRDLGEGEARYRAIESLFVETADGERFRVPSRNLTHGRLMARHVAEGGTPYDAFGQHITDMMSEMATLQRFVRAARHRTNNAEAAAMLESAVRHYNDLKAKAKRMISQRGYQEARESFDPAQFTDSEVTVEAIRDMFLENNLDSRIEEALPVLARLQTQSPKEYAMREIHEFANWAQGLTEGTWALPDTPEAERRLQQLMAQELPVGPDATNATEQIYDLIGDDELFDQLEMLARDDPDADARPLIQARLEEMGFDIGMNDEPDADQELQEDEEESRIPGLTYKEIFGVGKPRVENLPFGQVTHRPTLRTPTDAKILFVKRLMEKYGLDQRTATDIMKAVELDVAKGTTWDWAVENQLAIFNVADPFADEREQEYNADQIRVRQQTINTLKNFYKLVKQKQGQERAQAIARLRQIWNQGTPEEQAEADRMFGDDPQWQQIKSKLVMKPSQPVGEAAYPEARNEQGLTQQEWMRKLKAAGGRILASAKMPNGPVIGELNGKRRTWKPMPAAEPVQQEDLDVDGVMMTRPSNMSSESVERHLDRLLELAKSR